jgi:pimeloyl-ACP methyl ester carboxylesterase
MISCAPGYELRAPQAASDEVETMIGYVVHGRGPARAIVLHGWFGDRRVFEPMLDALDADRFSLAFLDYRGYGGSRDMQGPYTIDTIAADAEKLASHLGWGKFAIVGHSMGGKAALRVTVNIPERVSRILALTPVWAGPAPFDEATVELFRAAARDVAVRQAIINNSTGARLPSAWVRSLANKSMEDSSVEAFAAYFESWALSDFAAQAGELPHETLVVVGAEDGGVTEEAADQTWIANLRGARKLVLPSCGHYPMLETPINLAAIFESFLTTPK